MYSLATHWCSFAYHFISRKKLRLATFATMSTADSIDGNNDNKTNNENDDDDEPEWLNKDLWDDMFDGLCLFQKQHGHLDPPLDYQYHDEYLAIWLDQQRKQERLKSKGRRLSQEKIDRLKSIGIDFENGNDHVPVETTMLTTTKQGEHQQLLKYTRNDDEPMDENNEDDEEQEKEDEDEDVDEEQDEHWEFMFKGLTELKKTLQHTEPPKGCEYFGISLYDWAKEQRDRYKNYRKRNTWRTKIARLRNLGFELHPGNAEKRKHASTTTASSSHAAAAKASMSPYKRFVNGDMEGHWSMMLSGLAEYQKLRHGKDLDVPPGCEYNGFSLYDWVRKQKKHYRNTLLNQKPFMPMHRMQQLATFGFDEAIGNIPKHFAMTLHDARYEVMVEALKDFYQTAGSTQAKVPSTYIVDGRSLQKWVTKQRSNYQNRLEGRTKMALSDDRIEKLLAIGFEFTPVRRRVDAIENSQKDPLEEGRSDQDDVGHEDGEDDGGGGDEVDDNSEAASDEPNEQDLPPLKKPKLDP
ncbi:hypothetical protein MPSEU_000813300 [Mayamaea pseudoterrestris]|nr:hypothetical protein MPSEU_000813300 [Mayamaea pseudoterrestris]